MSYKKAMWSLEELQYDDHKNMAFINGKCVYSRPLNYSLHWCSITDRIYYALQVLIGKHETFEWPEGQ